MRACRRTSATSCAWSRACRAARRRSALAKGSCRDTGWLLVTILRHLGFAARFASGYLIQLMPDEKPLDGPEGPTHDFTDLHAWCEVYLPGAGWIGLDPTSGLLTGEGHIPLACTPEPSSAAPIEGAVEESEVEFVLRHEGDARARDAAHHQALHRRAVGEAARRSARRSSATSAGTTLRLTMGGEPTFVSIDDMDGAEWNTLALGPEKRRWPACCSASSPTASPRGRCCISARANGIPASSCRAGRSTATGARTARRSGATRSSTAAGGQADRRHAGDGAALRAGLRQRLQLDPGYLFGAFEDTWYYLWRERRLPSNVAVDDAKVKDPMERERLARVFEKGLESAVGTVLPHAQREHNGRGRWRSGPWFLRSEKCYLIPGDSPIGYRLPLDSLPWAAPAGHRLRSPSPIRWRRIRRCRRSMPSAAPRCCAARNAACRPTPTATATRAARPGGGRWRPISGCVPASATRPATSCAPRSPSSRATAISIVFMPPTERTEDYLDLVTAVEDTAEELGQPVFIEGYPPPGCDPRLQSFSVTPDPGVIEVNIHPSANWRELVDQDRDRLRGGAHDAARRPEIHDRRPPYRHRRRQPCHPGRTVGRRIRRCCAGPTC